MDTKSREIQIARRAFLQVAGIGVPLLSSAACGGVLSPISADAADDAKGESDGVGVTRLLADWVCKSQPADVPESARKEAVRSIVNYVGCALGGAHTDTVDCAIHALAPFSGPPQAGVFGRSQRFDLLHAALFNGISSHVLDYDDTQLATLIHQAAPVASALFPLAETKQLSGSALLHAFILGVEVECRIGKAVYPAHYDAGWHITGTAGVFGAAAAAGKVIGLTPRQLTWALGIAATQSSGLREMFGTMCKSLHPGRAAQNGLTAAFLAASGFTSTEQGIEGKRSFAYVMSSERDFSAITRGLGETFEISEDSYKPFACGVVVHPVIDACLQLRQEHGLTAEMIESINLQVHPLVLELTGNKKPQTGLEGKFSVYHSAAVAIIQNAASPSEYTDALVRDPAVVALRDRVRATASPMISEEQARVTILLRGGGRFEKFVEHAVGSLKNPMSDAQLDQKFQRLAESSLSRPEAARLLELCRSIQSLDDAARIPAAAVPSDRA
jgi:2-methylcitrate dehydratase PrpD